MHHYPRLAKFVAVHPLPLFLQLYANAPTKPVASKTNAPGSGAGLMYCGVDVSVSVPQVEFVIVCELPVVQYAKV